jgi:ribonuclease P protein component
VKHSIVNQDFKKILFNSKSLLVRDLLFYYQKNQYNGIAFIVSRKLGNAVVRNKFKRRCRFLFLNTQKNKAEQLQIVVRPKKKLINNYSWIELTRSFKEFYIKLEQ